MFIRYKPTTVLLKNKNSVRNCRLGNRASMHRSKTVCLTTAPVAPKFHFSHLLSPFKTLQVCVVNSEIIDLLNSEVGGCMY
jgi:hypothetical protein